MAPKVTQYPSLKKEKREDQSYPHSYRGHHCSRIDSLHRQSRRHADPSFPPFLPPHQIFPSAWSPASKARKEA